MKVRDFLFEGRLKGWDFIFRLLTLVLSSIEEERRRSPQGTLNTYGVVVGRGIYWRQQPRFSTRAQVLELAVVNTAPGKKVLVVEDEADVVEMLVRAFNRAAGFNVITAADGAVGLRRAREESPVLVILDLMLPKMPGLEVCKILKGDSLTRHIPILMLTAKAEEIDRIVGLELGADDYVSKPFSPREVVLRAQAILRRGETPGERESRMLWCTLGIALLLVVATAFVLQRLYLRPWRELEQLLTRIGRGEQPPTFLLGGITRARRVGLALEQLLARQRELDRQVSKDAAEVRAVLTALTDGLLVVDSAQHILICNPAFEQLYGQSHIATGTALLDIVRDSDVIEPIRAALDQARARVAEVSAPDRKKQLQLTAVPITQNGEASGVVAVFHDISRLKQP